jgi:hypothetical protein
MDDRVTDLLRRTLAAKAADISDDQQPFAARPTTIPIGTPAERGTRWPWWVAAAAAIVMVIGAAVVVVGRSGSDRGGTIRPAPADPPSLPPVPVDTSTPDSTEIATPDEDGLADSTTVASNATGWFLPTYVPGHFVPIVASAIRQPPISVESLVTNEVFVRNSPDGTIPSRIWLSAYRSTGSGEGRDMWGTVHGLPAEVHVTGQVSTVVWDEHGLRVTLRAELNLTDALAMAERTQVAPTGVSLDASPEGFARFTRSTTDGPPPGAIQLRVVWADPALTNAEVTFLATPNHGLESIETLATSGSPRRVEVGGRPALVVQASDGPGGDAGTALDLVQWVGDGYVFTLTGPAASEPDLLAMAASVQAVGKPGFHAVAAAATEHALEVPAIDEATFADGLRVSVRTDQGRSLVMPTDNALICAELERRHCAWNGAVGGSGFGPEQELQIDLVTGTFNVRGAAEMLVWVRGAGQPTIETTGVPTPTVETVRTDLGVFLRLPIGDGVGTVRINHGDGGTGFGAAGEVFDPDVG